MTKFVVMRISVVITLGLLMLVSTSRDALIYTFFKLQQDAITNRLCINVNQPDVRCQGVCYYNKKIAEQRELPQLPLPTVYDYTSPKLMVTTLLDLAISTSITHTVLVIPQKKFHSQVFTEEIFRPPKKRLLFRQNLV